MLVPLISATPGLYRKFHIEQGSPALVKLKLKFKQESKPILHEIWLSPDWKSPDLWKTAHQLIQSECRLFYYSSSDVEEARFVEFKIV